MAKRSTRLSNEKISSIVSRLVEPKYEEAEELNSELSKLCEEILKPLIPKDVMMVFNNHPGLVDRQRNILILEGDIWRENVYAEVNLPSIEGSTGITANGALEQLRSYDRIKKKAQVIYDIRKDAKSLKSQMSCVISDLRTYGRLQDEFPEAYKVLIEEVEKEHLYDSVESVRAKLQSKK